MKPRQVQLHAFWT